MKPFVYTAIPARVVFGAGTSKTKLQEEIKRLGCSRAIIVTGPRGRETGEDISRSLPQELVVGIYSKAAMHTPRHVTDDALEYARKVNADCAVAIGGGSAIGLAKALALHTNGSIKQIAIPTTYAGSETTQILGETKDGVKVTQKSSLIPPQTIIYDTDLTKSLPAQLTLTSGINAIAHAVEALYSADANPVTDLQSIKGIEALSRAIPVLVKDVSNAEARSEAQYGAWLCAIPPSAVGLALHHKLCHTLGGSFNMPHSETHTVLLPHSAAYNAPYAPDAMAKIAAALGVANAPQGLYDLTRNNGGPYSLKSLGFKEEDLEKAADLAVKAPYPNPAPLERDGLLRLLRNAYEGTRPE